MNCAVASKARTVRPDDEAEEIRQLLTSNTVAFYETPAGKWGISAPAIWLQDKNELQRAKVLIEVYQQERFARRRQEFESLKRQGKHKTIADAIAENPLRFVVYFAVSFRHSVFSVRRLNPAHVPDDDVWAHQAWQDIAVKAYVVFIGMALLTACATPTVEPTAREGEPTVPIYLVSQGWHTGLVIRRADVPEGLWPEAGDFPQAEYLEVGWGDRDYYQARDSGLWTTLKAALVPTPSVLHVVGFRGAVAEYFRTSEVVELRLPHAGFKRLAKYIHASHAREGTQPLAPLGSGLYGDSRFYPAREMFHLFNTCNIWTARALRAAGLPVRNAITTEGLMSQACHLVAERKRWMEGVFRLRGSRAITSRSSVDPQERATLALRAEIC